RRADLVRVDAERVRHRQRDHEDDRSPDARCRHERVHRPAVRPALGAVRRGRGADGASRDDPRLLAAEVDGRGPDRGLRQGMTLVENERLPALAEPHHDGSELGVVERPDEVGGTAVLRLRAPQGAADAVALRYVRDGEPRTVPAFLERDAGGETWWCAE